MARASGTTYPGPHQANPAADGRERFTIALFDRLWDEYRGRVSYVARYEEVVRAHRATFVNDHIAFRTFACQRPATGIFSIARIFDALGYRAAGNYHFEDKHLTAIHLQHPNTQFPKLFVSELKTWELSPSSREKIERSVANHRPMIDADVLEALARLDDASAEGFDRLLETTAAQFEQLPWPVPDKADVLALNRESQYAAWVLVHGYNVNHFTSLVNSHGVASLDNLEKTIDALRRAGVPMKAEIEGEPGSKLRQSATEAVTIPVAVMDAGRPTTIDWTYAYFELAERNEVLDPKTGQRVRFEGFLGPQATNLFEMTRVK